MVSLADGHSESGMNTTPGEIRTRGDGSSGQGNTGNHEISYWLVVCLVPVILAVGTAGNILSFLVLSKKRMRRKSVYFYLLLLAGADTVVLYTNALNSWARKVFRTDLYMNYSDVTCKIYMYTQGVMLHMSAWLVVLVTVDRFIAVLLPLKAATLCTSRRAAIISSVTFVILLLYHSHVLWTYELLPSAANITGQTTTYYCYVDEDVHAFYPKGDYYLHLITYSLLPFGIVFALNALIVAKLKSRPGRAQTNGLLGGGGGGRGGSPCVRRFNSNDARIGRMTRVLFLVTFTWLVLSTPITLTDIVLRLVPAGSVSSATKVLVRTVSFILLWVNHAVNFYLYCCSGKKLRGMIYEEVCCLTGTPNRNSMRNSTQRTVNMTSMRLTSARRFTD